MDPTQIYELNILKKLFTGVSLLWVLCWVDMPTWKLTLVTLVVCVRSSVFLRDWNPCPDELGDCPHLRTDSSITSIFIVWIYTWGEGYISGWEHCIGELCLLFCRMGDSPMPVIAGRATIKWAMGTVQLTARTLAGSGCLGEHRSVGSPCSASQGGLMPTMQANQCRSHELAFSWTTTEEIEGVTTFNRADTGILILEKTLLLLPSSKELFFGETIRLQNDLHLKFYPQWVFLIFFFHRLHVDNTSLLVTHHTTHRGVRHSGDYLVDNPLFLLETFQGWSNSNHTEKKVKQTVQYYGNWLHLVQKNIKGPALSSIFLFILYFFLHEHTFFPNPFPSSSTTSPHLPAGIHVQSKIAKLTVQYCSQRRS